MSSSQKITWTVIIPWLTYPTKVAVTVDPAVYSFFEFLSCFSFLVMLASRNVFHVVSALQSLYIFEKGCPTKPYATMPKAIMGNRVHDP